MRTRQVQIWLPRFAQVVARCAALLTPAIQGDAQTPPSQTRPNGYLFDDMHFHLTNYVQEGIRVQDFMKIMGDKAGRSTLFGIPLQQQWSYLVDADRRPTYYLNSDAPLYYYSFTDAWIAASYRSL